MIRSQASHWSTPSQIKVKTKSTRSINTIHPVLINIKGVVNTISQCLYGKNGKKKGQERSKMVKKNIKKNGQKVKTGQKWSKR